MSSNKKIVCECEQCGKKFFINPSRLKNNRGRFCSQKCHSESRKTGITRNCKVCGKEFYMKLSLLKTNKGIYCSKKCAVKDLSGEKSPNYKGKIKITCLNCGKEFEQFPSRDHMKYCCKKCAVEGSKGKRVEQECAFCGKTFKVREFYVKRGQYSFCSFACRTKAQIGEKNPNWRGGISFEPYCPKFNEEFKERVRNFFDRTCQICGKPEKDDIRRLHVHHVNYEKMVCCNDTPPLFIPLCSSCHIKTNFNRGYWEWMLTEFVMICFNGESYLPK